MRVLANLRFSRSNWQRRELKQREFKAFDEFSHKRKVKCIDGVAGKVVVRVSEEGGVCDHQGWQTCVPERGVITQARFGQDPSIEGKEKRLG